MTKRKQESTKKSRLVQTRLTPSEERLFEAIANRLGMKGYTFMSNMVDCILRFSDDMHALSPDLEQVIRMYEGFSGWANMGTAYGPGTKVVEKCVYLLRELADEEGEHGRKVKGGLIPILVDGPMDRGTLNKQTILEEVMKSCCPYLYKRLKDVAESLETRSLYDTILTLADLHGEDPDDTYLRELFADCRRDVYGKDWREQQRYVRHNNRKCDE